MRRAPLASLAAALAACLFLSSCGLLYIIGLRPTSPAKAPGSSSGDGTIAVKNVSPGTILDYFSEIAIGSEYGESAEIICKWTKRIRYCVEGDATDADRELLERLCERLNEIDGFPGISEALISSTANMTVSFVSRDEIEQMFENADQNCAGMASYEWENGEIISARCAIDRDLTTERECTICEDFLQSLGPARDSYMFPNSVFYQGFTITPFPIDLDFAVLEILYSPALPAGTPRLEAMSAAATLVKWTQE